MSQTSRDRDNSRRVRTHEKNSGGTVRRLGTIIQSIFCSQSGSGIDRHLLESLEIVRWESVPRGSFARTWKLSSCLFSRPDWLPLGLRGCLSRSSCIKSAELKRGVERGSTFTLTSDLSCIASILFANGNFTHVRMKITRHWKSTLTGARSVRFWRCTHKKRGSIFQI